MTQATTPAHVLNANLAAIAQAAHLHGFHAIDVGSDFSIIFGIHLHDQAGDDLDRWQSQHQFEQFRVTQLNAQEQPVDMCVTDALSQILWQAAHLQFGPHDDAYPRWQSLTVDVFGDVQLDCSVTRDTGSLLRTRSEPNIEQLNEEGGALVSRLIQSLNESGLSHVEVDFCPAEPAPVVRLYKGGERIYLDDLFPPYGEKLASDDPAGARSGGDQPDGNLQRAVSLYKGERRVDGLDKLFEQFGAHFQQSPIEKLDLCQLAAAASRMLVNSDEKRPLKTESIRNESVTFTSDGKAAIDWTETAVHIEQKTASWSYGPQVVQEEAFEHSF